MNRINRLMLENSFYGCPTVNNAFMKLVTVDSELQKEFLEKINWRKNNRYWLNKSIKIAIKILRKIRIMKINKYDLANLTDITTERINTILSGSADLTLSEIGKIEKALKVKL